MELKCNNNCCESNLNSSYIKRILEMIGPVILGSKPCEIVNVSGNHNEKENKLFEIISFFSNCSKITYRIVTTNNGGKRVLFINESSMKEVLSNKRSINFLKFLGYKYSENIYDYINELVRRLESNNFPHEIGVFLGYPLKDVLGFMGYSKKELVEICNWRIYGDKEISHKIYNKFIEHKAIMKNMIQTMEVHDIRRVI